MFLKAKINFAKSIVFANLFNVKTPLNVTWFLTNRCNYRCAYCTIPSRKQIELSTSQIVDLIGQMADAGVERICLTGGEPLCRKDIGMIIDSCQKKKIYTTMVSNGYYVKKRLSGLKNLNLLVLSLDGSKKVHEINRPKGSFESVIGAIKAAGKNIPIMTNTVLNKDNQDSIDFILQLSRKYRFVPYFNVIKNKSSLIPKDTYVSSIRILIARKKQGFSIANSFAVLHYYLSLKDFSSNITSAHGAHFPTCWAGRLFCDIDADGTMMNCYLHGFRGLNVASSGFRKAFYSLKESGCAGCICANLVELNYICSLNLGNIYERLKLVDVGLRRRNLLQDKLKCI